MVMYIKNLKLTITLIKLRNKYLNLKK
jgi:hypothetical protein